MVSVPITSRQSVDLAPVGNDRLRYAAPRNLAGAAVEQFGKAVGRAAQEWDAIEATFDEADALRIANEYATYERERLRTGEKAFLSTQGFNAGEGMEGAVRDIRSGAQNLLTGARSQRARAMAKRALDTRLGAAEEKIAAHATEQMTAARNEQSLARISGAVTDAVDQRGTDQFAVNLALAQMELAQMGARLGWGQEKIGDENDKLLSNAYTREVFAIDAEDGNPTRALARLDEIKDFILPDDEARLRNSLNPRVDAAWADEIVGSGELFTYAPTIEQPAAPADEQEGEAAPVTLAVPFLEIGTTVPGGRFGAARSYGAHTGMDFAGLPPGTAVPPSAPGTVIKSEYRQGYGHRVEVDHGTDAQGRRIVTTYSHLDGPRVEVGDRVDASTALGGVGSSGGDYGTHLHWEVLVDGRKVDPSSVADIQVSPGAAGAPGVPADPRLNSAQMRDAVDRYVSANPGISERRKQALYAAADRAVAQGRADRAQAEQDADRRLQDWLTRNMPGADDLTDMGQIPAAILSGSSPSTVAAVQSRIQAANSRIQAAQDAQAAARAEAIEREAVFELYTLSDVQLAGTDLRRYAGRIGLDKLGPWVDRQQRIAGQAGPAPVSTDRIASKIDSLGKPYGASRAGDATEEQRAAWIALRGYVESRIAGRANREVSDEELRGIIVSGMTEVELPDTGGWFSGNDTIPRSQVQPGQKFITRMPSNVSREIERNLRARGIARPSADLIWQTYQEGRARGVYN